MPTFALITEGPTDQVVLDHIINLVCSSSFDDDLEINYLQPLRDETDTRAKSFGGWELVFEYCRTGFNDALGTNDYVVIHIDTDVGEEKNFGLQLTHEGRDREHDDIIEDTRQIIISHIGLENFNAVKERVVFAISVHSIESWLLLYFFNKNEPKNSIERLNRLLRRADKDPLVKEIGSYRNLVQGMKLKGIKNILKIPGSFSVFLQNLSLLKSEEITQDVCDS